MRAAKKRVLLLPSRKPVAVTKEWISRAGVTTTRETRRIEMVVSRASLRAMGSKTSVISQKMSSASSAERAMVVEKVMTAARSDTYLSHVFNRERGKLNVWRERCESALLPAFGVPPESAGKSLDHAKKATRRKVRMKGVRARAAAEGVRCSCTARRE